MVAEGLLPELPHAFQEEGFETNVRKSSEASKYGRYGLPIALSTPEKAQQIFKARGKY
jgi:hypothetical protein